MALALTVLVCVDWSAARLLRADALRDAFNQLEALGHIAQARPPRLDDAESLRVWLAEMSASGARVTIIAADGRVLAESQHDPETMENHAARPEIHEAFASSAGEGRAVRHSATLDRDLVYYALRHNTAAVPVVLRFALPLAPINAALAEVRRQLWLTSIGILLVAVAVSIFFSRWFSSRVRRLKEFASRAAAGDFTPLERDRAHDELAELAYALDGTVAQLGHTIHTLTDERNRSAAILGSMVEGVAVVGGDERILYCNRAFERILELREGISQGKKLVEALRQAELVSAVRQVLTGSEEVTGEVEVGTIHPRNFSMTAAPVQVAGVSSAVLVLHDITNLRRLERVRRDFVANVSHEFKTPLTAIQGFAETLLGGALDDKTNRERFVEIIREQARRLARLTDDLLKLSRIEAGQAELELRPISVAALVNGCVETTRLKAELKGLRINVDLPEGLPPVRGDGAQLGEVLQNLLDNALQYTLPGGQIDVTARASDHEVIFTVADTGIGIPESDLERIFERFYRVDAARSREAGGTGLGLSIARHIVDAHGGRIWVESAVGQGSRFHFSIASAS
jgi:two-component system phosphate regulon sensor histidine kinase PhoR